MRRASRLVAIEAHQTGAPTRLRGAVSGRRSSAAAPPSLRDQPEGGARLPAGAPMVFGIAVYDLAWLAAALVIAGAVTGLLAGLFGVGGGAVIVPVLYELFRLVGVPEEPRMPLCVGTSLAIIIPTSIRSFRAHHAKGAVDLSVLRRWAVPVVVGVATG